MPIPLWAFIVGISLAKKVTVLVAAKLYGIPRLYRRCQKLVRFSAADSAQRHIWAGRVRTSFRLPQNIARSWHGQSPIATRYPSPAPLAERSSEGACSGPAALSFASAPLLQAPRQRMRERLQSNRQHLREVRARWKQQGQALTQKGLQQLQRCGSLAQPSLLAEAATMRFIRRARQAYQFVPAVAMCTASPERAPPLLMAASSATPPLC